MNCGPGVGQIASCVIPEQCNGRAIGISESSTLVNEDRPGFQVPLSLSSGAAGAARIMLIKGMRMQEPASMANSREPSCHSGKTCRSDEGVSPAKVSGISNVGERLHSQVHVCNHARCAANNPDYAVKAATPPKKFLVAKKHMYGGLDNAACDQERSHALHSLTNAVLQPKSGKPSRPSWNGPRSRSRNTEEDTSRHALANSVLQQNRGRDRILSDKKGAERERKGRVDTSPTRRSSYSSSRSVVTDCSSISSILPGRQQKSRLCSATSSINLRTVDQDMDRDDSPSPESSVTAVSVTPAQILTRREEGFQEQDLLAASSPSPTASVGSNHCTEFSSSKGNVVMVEGVMYDQMLESIPGVGDLLSPAGNSLSSSLQRSAVSEEKTYQLSTPSVDSITSIWEFPTLSPASRPTFSESKTPPIPSNPSRSSPSSASTTSAGSFLPNMPQVASNLAGKFITKLKENSKARSAASSSVALAKKPFRILKNSALPANVDSLPPTTTSNIARKFIADLQANTGARQAASSKGVRSIELRGGKAQTYSTTTVTSWNVTTTTVETSVSILDICPEKKPIDSDVSRPGSAAPCIKPPWNSGTKESLPIAVKVGPKVGMKSRGAFPNEAQEKTVSLKHGETVERRLSEEWMTNHALEGVVKNLVDKDHRVKLLVHAFESLATLADSEGHGSEDATLKTQLELEVLSTTPVIA